MGGTMKRKAITPSNAPGQAGAEPVAAPKLHQSRAEQYAAGKALRATCPRDAHGAWKAPANRRDAVELVLAAEAGRVPICCLCATGAWSAQRSRSTAGPR